MGRHPTVLQTTSTSLHRIPLRISLDRSNPLNLNFFLAHFWTKNVKKWFSGGKKTPLRGTPQLPWRAWRQIRPIGAQGAHVAPWGGNSTPYGAHGGPMGPHGAPMGAPMGPPY